MFWLPLLVYWTKIVCLGLIVLLICCKIAIAIDCMRYLRDLSEPEVDTGEDI